MHKCALLCTHIRTEKDALYVPLEGPTGHIQNMPGYGILLVQTSSKLTENVVMLTILYHNFCL